MKTNAVLFWLLSLFFGLVAVVYGVWTLIDYPGDPLNSLKPEQTVEWVGVVALSLTSALGAFLGFYFQRTYNAQNGELPEDRLDADIDDGEAEQGFFSPWSWWPLTLGFGIALVFLGVAVGFWIVFIGIPIALVALVGWQFEYYRGNFGR